MFGVIQECRNRPRVLRKSKKNESTVFKRIPLHIINYDDNLETIAKDKLNAKHVKHSEKQVFARDLNARLKMKLDEYEKNIEKRRERLRDLLWKEEREQVREAVNATQTVDDNKYKDMQIRIQELKNRREADRLQVVKEKKFQQYINKCDEFRPLISQRRCVESKEAQLMQIRENEGRRENEKKVSHVWYEVLLKEIRAKAEREEQERLAKKKQQAENRCAWDTQCKYQELQKEQAKREIKEEQIKMNHKKEQWRQEEVAELDAKRRNREQFYMDIVGQIKEHSDVLRKKQEHDKAEYELYQILQKEELEKEWQRNKQSQKAKIKEEMDMFMVYFKQLEEEQRAEEKRLEELVQQELKEIQAKQDEAACKLKVARMKLSKSLKDELDEQLKYRREEMEQQLKIKETENELIRLAYDQNQRLQAEYERQKLVAEQQYKDDLKKQIAYKKLQKERESEELKNLLARGRQEEEEYRKLYSTLLNSEIKIAEEHPFKKLMDKQPDMCHKYY